jgi:hypothetical protein
VVWFTFDTRLKFMTGERQQRRRFNIKKLYFKVQQSFGLSCFNCHSSLGEGVVLNDRLQRVHYVLTDYAHF